MNAKLRVTRHLIAALRADSDLQGYVGSGSRARVWSKRAPNDTLPYVVVWDITSTVNSLNATGRVTMADVWGETITVGVKAVGNNEAALETMTDRFEPVLRAATGTVRGLRITSVSRDRADLPAFAEGTDEETIYHQPTRFIVETEYAE